MGDSFGMELTEVVYISGSLTTSYRDHMDERDQQRKIRHRIAVLRHAAEVTGNVAKLAATTGSADPRSTNG